MPLYAIRVAGTDGLTGLSTLPQLSTGTPPVPPVTEADTRGHAPGRRNGDLLPSVLFRCILISLQSHRQGNEPVQFCVPLVDSLMRIKVTARLTLLAVAPA